MFHGQPSEAPLLTQAVEQGQLSESKATLPPFEEMHMM